MTFQPLFGWGLTVLFALAAAGLLWWARRAALAPTADAGARTSWGRRVALAVVVLLVLAGPSVPVTESVAVSSLEIYLVVDRTGSMGAEDWAGGPSAGGGTRLDGVRADLTAIKDAHPDARYSIIALDSAAKTELPLTSDVDAVTAWINALRQETTDRSGGSSLERALPLLAQTLSASQESAPEDARVVYVLSDGEATDDGAAATEAAEAGVTWKQVGAMVDGGSVLGYGTDEGGRMRESDGSGATDAPYIQDPTTGKDAVSVPDTKELKMVADDLGVSYYQRTGGSDDVPTKDFTTLHVDAGLTDGRERKSYRRYLTWPLGLVAAAILGWEAIALARTDRQLRRLARGTTAATTTGRTSAGGPR